VVHWCGLTINLHFTAEPRDIRRERGIVEPPVLQIVFVPLMEWEMDRYLHPVSLGFVITKHWWSIPS